MKALGRIVTAGILALSSACATVPEGEKSAIPAWLVDGVRNEVMTALSHANGGSVVFKNPQEHTFIFNGLQNKWEMSANGGIVNVNCALNENFELESCDDPAQESLMDFALIRTKEAFEGWVIGWTSDSPYPITFTLDGACFPPPQHQRASQRE